MSAVPCVPVPRFTRTLLDCPASRPPWETYSSFDRVSNLCYHSLRLSCITNGHAGPAPNTPFFTNRRAVFDLGDLSQPEVEVKTLKLTQRIGTHQLTVYASKFLPMPGDVVSYKWQDPSGNTHELKMPPVCLTNMDKVQTHIRQYIASAKWLYLNSLEQEDELAWMTVSTAMSYAKANPVCIAHHPKTTFP